MTKAEDLAAKLIIHKRVNVDELCKLHYTQGYHQAEKDLELTWEDLELLQDISREVFAEVGNGDVDYYHIYPTRQSFFEEVLKRYKAQKEND